MFLGYLRMKIKTHWTKLEILLPIHDVKSEKDATGKTTTTSTITQRNFITKNPSIHSILTCQSCECFKHKLLEVTITWIFIAQFKCLWAKMGKVMGEDCKEHPPVHTTSQGELSASCDNNVDIPHYVWAATQKYNIIQCF